MGAVALLIAVSLVLQESSLIALLRTIIGLGTLVILVMLFRSHQASKRQTLREIDRISRLLVSRRKPSENGQASSRRVH